MVHGKKINSCIVMIQLFFLLTFYYSALHLYKLSVADKLNAVVLEILMCVGVFHKLIFPYSVLPSAGDTLKLVAFNGRMDECFGNAVFGNVCPDFENCFSVCFVAYTHIVISVGEKKIIGNNNVIFLAPSL